MKYIFYIFFIVLVSKSYGQNDIKAKIEYEEAEKAFSENNYTISLQRLNEAEKMLGKTNTKILYLKIICQNEIIKPEPYASFEALVDIRKNCDAYMKMTDKKPDMYDKYKEVYKIKQDLEIYPKSLLDFNLKKEENLNAKKVENEKRKEVAREKEAFMNDLFERVNFTFEPDKSLDYYTSKYPEFNTFIKKAKKTKNGDKTSYTFKLGIGRVFGKLFKVELFDVTTKNDKVVYVYYTIMVGKNNESEDVANEYERLIQQAKNSYGTQSVIKSKFSETLIYIESKNLKFNCLVNYNYQSYNNEGILGVGFYTDEMGINK